MTPIFSGGPTVVHRYHLEAASGNLELSQGLPDSHRAAPGDFASEQWLEIAHGGPAAARNAGAAFSSLADLEQRLLDFQFHYERTASPFKWTFTRSDLHALLAKTRCQTLGCGSLTENNVKVILNQTTKLGWLTAYAGQFANTILRVL